MRRTPAIVYFCLFVLVLVCRGQADENCQPGAPCPVCDPPRSGTELDALREGNARFRSTPNHLHQSAECAKRLACCQKPFAIVLSCSDSRVPPEIVFDQGVGDLFTIRVAGNVASPAALGSIEYAVAHLGAKLVVVMGHQRCGAVEAAFCPRPGPHIDAIWDLIRPAVRKPLPSCEHHERVDPTEWEEAVRTNAKNMAKLIADDLRGGSAVKVVSAYYKLDDGTVEFLK
ncbi:MAG: carbonic anhydrase [Acidobacteriaceae bacterium]|nr:carbonic anhydrase [Acidobacteriaceae bacterium]MBV9779902.1 carbonic anhydrase [Acidobacteriaceae bacterium]